jgi:hypothetical protein
MFIFYLFKYVYDFEIKSNQKFDGKMIELIIIWKFI